MTFRTFQTKELSFKSKPEALLYLISWLDLIKSKYQDKVLTTINDSIDKAKIAFENHEQDLSSFCKNLSIDPNKLVPDDKNKFTQIIKEMTDYKENQTPEQKFENVLGRRAESELFTLLLTQPTPAMMESVGRVSNEIIHAIKSSTKYSPKLIELYLKLIELFLKRISNAVPNEQGFCGAFAKIPTIDDVIKVLTDNQNFPQIMNIHFNFAMTVLKETPIFVQDKQPIGELANIFKNANITAKEFFQKITQDDNEGTKWRSFISDKYIFKSFLFTAEPTRGRKASLNNNYTYQLGLMLNHQDNYAKDLPSLSLAWDPDCKNQEPLLQSPAVTDLINNDAIYVAGYSGMCSLLLGQMEVLANFENENLKKNYLSAATAYIVGGGFHSLHEVLGPAEYSLKLIPGYSVTPPDEKKQALPPNYHTFYSQQSMLDKEFGKHLETAWKNLIVFFKEIYLPKNAFRLPNFNEEAKSNEQFFELKEKLLKELQLCINAMQTKLKAKSSLSFTKKKLFSALDESLILATGLSKKLMHCSDISELTQTINSAKTSYQLLKHKMPEKTLGETFDIVSTLNVLEEMIKSKKNQSKPK